MSGELLTAWSRTWKELWVPLAKTRGMPEDAFATLVADLFAPQSPESPPQPPASAFNMQGELIDTSAIAARNRYSRELEYYNERVSEYETARASEVVAKKFFKNKIAAVSSEAAAICFLEATYQTLTKRFNVSIADRFHELVHKYLIQFNIKYEVRKPFSLNATMSGVFSMVLSELRSAASGDAHIDALVREFEEAYADLRSSKTQARMKTCLQKQYNLLEGLGQACPHVTANTLGAICNQLDWPHEQVKEVGKGLYRFGCDYPGLRHGGAPANRLRDLDMRDFLSLSLMLASFTPYVAHNLDPNRCYGA